MQKEKSTTEFQKNSRYHWGIGRNPYKAMFGTKSKLGISTLAFPKEVLSNIITEEQLAEVLNSQVPESKNVF